MLYTAWVANLYGYGIKNHCKSHADWTRIQYSFYNTNTSKLCKITMFTKYFNEMFHYFKSKKIKTNVYISQDIVSDLQHTN